MQFLVELLHKKKELAVTPDMKLNVFHQVLILMDSCLCDDIKFVATGPFPAFVSPNRATVHLHLHLRYILCMLNV